MDRTDRCPAGTHTKKDSVRPQHVGFNTTYTNRYPATTRRTQHHAIGGCNLTAILVVVRNKYLSHEGFVFLARSTGSPTAWRLTGRWTMPNPARLAATFRRHTCAQQVCGSSINYRSHTLTDQIIHTIGYSLLPMRSINASISILWSRISRMWVLFLLQHPASGFFMN